MPAVTVVGEEVLLRTRNVFGHIHLRTPRYTGRVNVDDIAERRQLGTGYVFFVCSVSGQRDPRVFYATDLLAICQDPGSWTGKERRLADGMAQRRPRWFHLGRFGPQWQPLRACPLEKDPVLKL